MDMGKRYYLANTKDAYLITNEAGGMRKMFTVVNGVVGLSKDGGFAEKALEDIGDGLREVVLRTYSGDEYCLDCDDFALVSVKEVSYDTCEEDVYKDGITMTYELDKSNDLENCHMVKLKGICFSIIKFDDLILLNNQTSNVVEYKCKTGELKDFLESVDEHYDVYRKEYSDL